MILRRYINAEVLKTSLVVMIFLLMMTVGNWLIRYFGMAAKGKLSFGVVFELMSYQIPVLMEFILPLGLFIGLMLTFGRQYVEHEMSIIKASGMSPSDFAKLLLPLLFGFFILQAFLSLYARPAGLHAAEKLKMEQAVKSTFDLVRPKEFVTVNQYSLYVGKFSEDKRFIEDIILIERGGAPEGRDRIILASRAEQVNKSKLSLDDAIKENSQLKDVVTQLDFFKGRQYELGASGKKYNQVSFERYRLTIKLPNKKNEKEMKFEARSSVFLWQTLADSRSVAELGYRMTLPFIIFLAVILALPLSYVRPRQGRWLRLLPAILLFATSVLILNSFKGTISKGKLPVFIYPVILFLYALFGIYLYHKNTIHFALRRNWFGKHADVKRR